MYDILEESEGTQKKDLTNPKKIWYALGKIPTPVLEL